MRISLNSIVELKRLKCEPVEIMLGWKYDALTLGVACNEYENDQWDPKKVERLSRAKVDIMVLNFSTSFEDLKSILF